MNIGLKVYKDIEKAVSRMQKKIRVLEDTFLPKEETKGMVIEITEPIVTSVETLNKTVVNMQTEINNLKQKIEELTPKPV